MIEIKNKDDKIQEDELTMDELVQALGDFCLDKPLPYGYTENILGSFP